MTKNHNHQSPLLREIGLRVRALRQAGNLTVREFAARAQLSQRFINQIENGTGNISIGRLENVAEALGCTLPELLPLPARDQSLRTRTWRFLRDCTDEDLLALHTWLEKHKKSHPVRLFVALIGVRGCGKSTIGPLLARRLKTEFVELDHWVEKAAGMPLPEIFHLHGEAYYRRLESEAVSRLFTTSAGCVFAPGGSIVNDNACWDLIKQRCVTVWLQATPKELLRRMVRAGETRLTQNPTVMSDLKTLLASRDPLYAQSHITTRTTGKKPAEIASLIARAVRANEKG
jgi:XRE family aerobic/anaerobic benzoate catabolism transcriptional regulator